jgi:hypothetical protein
MSASGRRLGVPRSATKIALLEVWRQKPNHRSARSNAHMGQAAARQMIQVGQARAVRRMGELLKEYDGRGFKKSAKSRGGTKSGTADRPHRSENEKNDRNKRVSAVAQCGAYQVLQTVA